MKNHLTKVLLLSAAVFAAAPQRAQTPPGYTISGEVRDAAGQKVFRVRVCAVPDVLAPGRFFPCVSTNADGRFLIRVREPGRYRLYTDKESDGYVGQFHPFYRNPSVPVPEVTLGGGNPAAQVFVPLGPKNGLLTGGSVDATTGLPVEAVTFVMCRADDPRVCFNTSAKNERGTFKVSAPLVPFTLRVEAEGYDDWNGLDGREGAAGNVSVPPGEELAMAVRLRRRADAAGAPLSEAEKTPGVNLPAPAQASPADGAVLDRYPRTTRLEWAAVEGAASYAVEVDYCKGGRQYSEGCFDPQPLSVSDNPPTRGITGTTYEFDFIGMCPGRWRVWAVARDGREGFKSPWRRFVYTK